MWDEAEEVPRAGIPSTDRLAKRMRWYKRVIWLLIVCFPITAAGLFVAATSLKAATKEHAVVKPVTATAKAAATIAVTDWLRSAPQPLPGGALVSWDEATKLPAYVPTSADTKEDVAAQATLAAHSLTVRNSAGDTFIVQVLVASNRLGENTVVGTPALLPEAPVSDWAADVSPWPNLEGTTAPDTAAAAVDAWVEAFASGDPDKLRLTVGDPDANHSYVPMTGMASAKGTVGSAAWVQDDKGEKTTSMLVQVEVAFMWPGADAKTAGPQSATYDLLVTGASSGAPRVVAWGGPGTGPVLAEYDNAIVGRQLKAAEPGSSTAPTSSSTAAPTTPAPAPTATKG
jgi:hypothetical protein